jgi:hypothetical protein
MHAAGVLVMVYGYHKVGTHWPPDGHPDAHRSTRLLGFVSDWSSVCSRGAQYVSQEPREVTSVPSGCGLWRPGSHLALYYPCLNPLPSHSQGQVSRT